MRTSASERENGEDGNDSEMHSERDLAKGVQQRNRSKVYQRRGTMNE